MKKITSIFLINLLVWASVAGQRNVVEVSQSFPSADVEFVYIASIYGNITVTGDAGEETTVVVQVTGDENLPESRIRELLEEHYSIGFPFSDGRIDVIAFPRERRDRSAEELSFNIVINIPAGVGTNIQTRGGNISVSSFTGFFPPPRQGIGDHPTFHRDQVTARFETLNGSLMLDNVSGNNVTGIASGGNIYLNNSQANNFSFETKGGSISVSNVIGRGNVRLTASGGSVSLNHFSGNIAAFTYGGNVSANDVRGNLAVMTSGGNVNINQFIGQVLATTSGGSLNVEMLSVIRRVQLINTGGNISLTLPAKVGFTLDVSTSGGVSTTNMQHFSGSVSDRTLNGNVWEGGPDIEIQGQQANLIFRELTFR